MIVIDALDECKDERPAFKILMAVAQYINVVPYLKVFVTSRPERSAREAFDDDSLESYSNVFILHTVDRRFVDDDIQRFLNARFQEMAKRRRMHYLSLGWPPQKLVGNLVQKASGLFIFASTLCKIIDSPGDIEQKLAKIAQLSTNENEGLMGIDRLLFDNPRISNGRYFRYRCG